MKDGIRKTLVMMGVIKDAINKKIANNDAQQLHIEVPFKEGWHFMAACGILALIFFFIPSKIEWRLVPFVAYLFLIARLHFEIRETNVAYLFRRGKLTGRLLAGWYFLIPFIYSIKVVSREMILMAKEILVITKDRYEVRIQLRLGFQLGESDEDLLKALYFGDDARNEDQTLEGWLWDVGVSKVKTAIGKITFDEFNSKQDNLETQTLDAISVETKKNGYHGREAEVVILEAPLATDAKKREVYAEVAGKEVEAIASKINKETVALILGRELISKAIPIFLGRSKAAKEVKGAATNKGNIKNAVDQVKDLFGLGQKKETNGGEANEPTV
ncbi:MAG: SPFH domain-containing protein [Candidatus Niyogibacteria bacterium]|nr:SPFH domain-containing protein [Candidatus Niyogibacteria bacterium]